MNLNLLIKKQRVAKWNIWLHYDQLWKLIKIELKTQHILCCMRWRSWPFCRIKWKRSERKLIPLHNTNTGTKAGSDFGPASGSMICADCTKKPGSSWPAAGVRSVRFPPSSAPSSSSWWSWGLSSSTPDGFLWRRLKYEFQITHSEIRKKAGQARGPGRDVTASLLLF